MDEKYSSFKSRPIVVGLAGVALAILGFAAWRVVGGEKTEVEIIRSREDRVDLAEEEVVAEIAGAVINPGVFRLAAGSRVEDLIVAGGGLAADADREWIGKHVNKALKITDGLKVFLPRQGEMEKIAYEGLSVSRPGLVDLNRASVSQLESLAGVGEVTARKIVEGRPYVDVGELKLKGVVGVKVFEKIKDQVVVY